MKAKLGIVAIVLGCIVGQAAWGASGAQNCQSSKLKVAANYSACRLKTAAKAVKRGSLPDYADCDAKFTSKWSGIEGRNYAAECLTLGDAADVGIGIAAATRETSSKLSGVRFIDNADGTITDTQTGLTWEKKIQLDGTSNFSNQFDADNQYSWSGVCSADTNKQCQSTSAAAALCAANTGGAATGCAECFGDDGTCLYATTTVWTLVGDLNAASFGGHTDWRIPTRQELETLLDLTDATPPLTHLAFHETGCGAACSDMASAACSCTKDNDYWSVSPSTTQPWRVWVVYFADGQVFDNEREGNTFTRAVRGP